MKALLALVLALASLAGCKKPTQQQYLQLATYPPAGAPELPFRTTGAPEHFKEDFIIWKKVPIRVRWQSAVDDAGCRRVLGADLSRTGGPVEFVVSAPREAAGEGPGTPRVDLHQQWVQRGACANGLERMRLHVFGKHGREDLTADFSIDGAGAITPARENKL